MRATLPLQMALLCDALLGLSCGSARSATIVINDTSDGHSRKLGATVTETTATIITGEGGGGLEYRGFVSFEITNVTGIVTQAEIRLQVQAYNNGATSLSFGLYDYVSGAPPGSVIGGDSTARFNDFGSGVIYGAASISTSVNPAGSFLSINLTSDALAAMNSGSGVWVVGNQRFFTIGLADLTLSGANSHNVRFTSGGTANRLTVETQPVPEPGSIGLLVMAGSLLGGATRFRGRIQSAGYPENIAALTFSFPG